MKRLIRDGVSTLVYRLRGPEAPGGVRMLMYHRVTDAHPTERLCVPVARFEAQMRWLRERGYKTISFSQAVEWARRGGAAKRARSASGCRAAGGGAAKRARSASGCRAAGGGAAAERTVAVTFDDGYEDNFLHAHPAMARYGFTGTFFAPSGFIEAAGEGCAAADRPMTWQQLQQLADHGHEIGAHSVSHRKLTTLDPVELFWEIRGCKEVLEYELDRDVEFFCYPAGDYDDLVKRVVQASGYRGACTVAPGAIRAGADPFALTRTEISGFDSLWDFEKKLAGAYDGMHRMLQTIHRLSPAAKRQPSNALTVGARECS